MTLLALDLFAHFDGPGLGLGLGLGVRSLKRIFLLNDDDIRTLSTFPSSRDVMGATAIQLCVESYSSVSKMLEHKRFELARRRGHLPDWRWALEAERRRRAIVETAGWRVLLPEELAAQIDKEECIASGDGMNELLLMYRRVRSLRQRLTSTLSRTGRKATRRSNGWFADVAMGRASEQEAIVFLHRHENDYAARRNRVAALPEVFQRIFASRLKHFISGLLGWRSRFCKSGDFESLSLEHCLEEYEKSTARFRLWMTRYHEAFADIAVHRRCVCGRDYARLVTKQEETGSTLPTKDSLPSSS